MMPSQSSDPISTALQSSLSSNSNTGSCNRKEEDLSLCLSYSAKQVLLSDNIEYVEFKYDTTSFLNNLKSKYTVISEKDEDGKSSPQNSDRLKIVDKIHKEFQNSNERLKATTKESSKPSLPTPSRTLWPPDAVALGWKPNTPVGGGFINLWNSCYLNSTLQALFHIPCFANWLLMENSHKCTKGANGSAECMICAMSHTLKNSQESTGRAIKPYLVYQKLKSICKHFNPGTQEDAHEFLRHLVDSLDRTYLLTFRDLRLDHLSKETTPLSQIFGGYLRNEVVCQACGHISTTFQYFQDLPLDIATCSHLEGALENFFSKESVSEHEGYKCENCKKKVPFTKKFSLEKAPKVLCIQLKRFGVSSGKNNKSITIAGKLQLNRFRAVKNSDSFEPYHFAAVVNHIGSSTSCGHYTAIAQAADNKFYLFDDSRVERLHDLNPNSSQAYILLYHQKPNNNKQELSSKLIVRNSVANSIQQSSNSQTSAKERLFGKDNSLVKTPFKLINKVANSITSVFTKVNGTIENGESSKSGESSSSQSKCSVSNENITNGSSDNSNEKEDSKDDKNSSSPPENKIIQNGHKSELNKSLVPYNESSCSSEEGSIEDPKPNENQDSNSEKIFDRIKKEEQNLQYGPSPPKKMHYDDDHSETNGTHSPSKNGTTGINSPAKNGTSTPTKNGSSSGSNSLKLTNGHISPGKGKFNGSIARSSGNWTVTSRSPSCSPDKSESSTCSWKIKGTSDDGNKDYRSKLMSVSHRGYGKPVSTWSGEKSELDKEISRDNYMNQRVNSYNDNYDMPIRKRKFRRENHHSPYNKHRFNDAQKRKNWFNNSNGYHRSYPGKRQRSAVGGENYYSKYSSYNRWDHH